MTSCVFRQKLKSLMDFIKVKHEVVGSLCAANLTITKSLQTISIYAEIPDTDVDNDLHEPYSTLNTFTMYSVSKMF